MVSGVVQSSQSACVLRAQRGEWGWGQYGCTGGSLRVRPELLQEKYRVQGAGTIQAEGTAHAEAQSLKGPASLVLIL